MKKIRFLPMILILFVTTTSNVAMAQQDIFTVIASYGEVFVNGTGNEEWSPVNSGYKLLKDDIVKMTGDVYLGLLQGNGATLELNKAGTYKVADLGGNSRGGVTQGLANYVLNDLNKTNGSRSVFASNMTVTGALERSTSKSSLEVFMPRTTHLIDKNVTFTWYHFEDAKEYVFTLTDRYARKVFQKNIGDTTVALNLSEYNLEKENCYYWTVSRKGNPKIKSEEYCLYLLSDKSASDLKALMKKVKKELGGNDSPLNSIMLASFYEQNSLLNEAMVTYKKAIKLAPEVEDFKKSYALFLIRIGLFSEAEKIWD